ncbi:MAG: hypothetical protein J0H12_02165 [Candidatus Paracaedimonas acanthamoebae]|uniref:Uncharacterized protein n=1 Tax=Candidatus Paracaedimonas acanthamoebae TaxID=244581 RepID=A0A8J7TU03_9PROT|nr:hypothetical protein [Candidatus Paracaedimonas acanthamoebae]
MVNQNNSIAGQDVMEQHSSKGFILRDGSSLLSLPTNDNKSPQGARIKKVMWWSLILGSILFLAFL